MGEPLKVFFSRSLVERLATDLAGVASAFDRSAFIEDASAGLEALELLDRAKHIAVALGRRLPPAYPDAIDVLLRSLGPEHASDELLGAGLAPFFYLPHTIFVAERGLERFEEHFELSMRAQYELTKRFSAESSIRPYIARDPERVFAVFEAWTRDPNPHVRRLVSEGTRLRLPWAMRIKWLDENPDRILGLLERLKDDAASVVRRSVANNLNDLGKVHPDLLTTTCGRWLAGASTERRALIQHALRSAIKRGDQAALALLGFGQTAKFTLDNVAFHPADVEIGERVTITFDLVSRARRSQELLVDLVVHFVKANGKPSPKVFKLDRVSLPPSGRVTLETRVSLAVHTTRKPYPGAHAVDVLVNGSATPLGAFHVIEASRRARPRVPAESTRSTPRARR